MTQPGAMPRPGSEPPLADRWLSERAALMVEGPAHRYLARGRVRRENVEVDNGLVYWLVVPRHVRQRVSVPWETELALYPLGSATGTLPLVIVEMPAEGVLDAVYDQGGEVDVRGEPAPGHGLVMVLDDGEAIGCTGPARPPPPVMARHLWGLPDGELS